MRRRDWAGTVLVACLTIAASLLRNHTLLLATLLAVGAVCALVIVWDVSGDRTLARWSKARDGLSLSLDRPCRELDNLLWIVQSDAPGYSVTARRGELAAISRRVRRLLNGRPDLRALYESPRPERQSDGQLIDHDERIFEAELEHRRGLLVEIAARVAKESAQ